MAARIVTVYIDYKSPYVYLAKDPARELEREFDVRLDWLPLHTRHPGVFLTTLMRFQEAHEVFLPVLQTRISNAVVYNQANEPQR